MSAAPTDVTRAVARRYFDAWTRRESRVVSEALALDFEFAAGPIRIAGRDAFLSAGAFPQDATVTMVAEAYDGHVAFQMYDAARGERFARIVEQLTVRDGMIVQSRFVTDMAAFQALTAP